MTHEKDMISNQEMVEDVIDSSDFRISPWQVEAITSLAPYSSSSVHKSEVVKKFSFGQIPFDSSSLTLENHVGTRFVSGHNIFKKYFDDLEKILEKNSLFRAKVSITTGYLNIFEWVEKCEYLLNKFPYLEFVIYLGKIPTIDHDSYIKKLTHDIVMPEEGLMMQDEYEYVATMLKLITKNSKRFMFKTSFESAKILHAKTMLLEFHGIPVNGVVGSMNLTQSGEKFNQEAAVYTDEPESLNAHKLWVESLNSNMVKANETMEKTYQHMARYQKMEDVYFVLLSTIFGGEKYQLEATTYDHIYWLQGLLPHQKHGALAAAKIIDEYNGVLIADEVGLGKTYIAIGLIRKFLLNRKKVLIVAPAVLIDTWEKALVDSNISLELHCKVISYNEMEKVIVNYDEFVKNTGLIVFDEAHWLRNVKLGSDKASQRSKSVEKLVLTSHAKIALLTATPINNALKDFWNELSLFIKNDILKDEGYPNLQKELEKLDKADMDLMSRSEIFSLLLNKISIIRTRTFVRENYKDHTVMKFPQKVHFERHSLVMSDKLKKLVYEVVKSLTDGFDGFNDFDNLHQSNKLLLSAYRPSQFLVDPEVKRLHVGQNEITNNSLIRSNLMKRLDSSLPAFIKSLDTIMSKTSYTLDVINNSKRHSLKEEFSIEDFEDIDIENKDIAQDENIKLQNIMINDLDKDKYKQFLERDLKILSKWKTEATEILTKEPDSKLADLCKIILNKYDNKSSGKKVLIFTTDQDTAQYLKDNLFEELENQWGKKNIISSEGGFFIRKHKIEMIKGTIPSKEKQSLINRFAPNFNKGNGSSFVREAEQIDILITTDVLSEGANLQESDTIIHYNLPWNPMRALQRIGRIDRLYSEYENIYSHCFYPGEFLSEFIKLEQIIDKKLHKARVAAGTNTKGLDGKEVDNFFDKIEGRINESTEEEFSLNIEDIAKFSESGYLSKLKTLEDQSLIKIPQGSGSLMISENTEEKILFCVKSIFEGKEKLHFYKVENLEIIAIPQNLMLFYFENPEGSEVLTTPFRPDVIKRLSKSFDTVKKEIVDNIIDIKTNPSGSITGNNRDIILRELEAKNRWDDYIFDEKQRSHITSSLDKTYPVIFVKQIEKIVKQSNHIIEDLIKIFESISMETTLDNTNQTSELSNVKLNIIAWLHIIPKKQKEPVFIKML